MRGDFLGEIPPEERRIAELQARRKAEKKRYRSTPGGRAEHNRSKRLGRMNARLKHPFVGVDGEGSEQAYLLLRAGDDYLHTGEPLGFVECMDFLCDLPLDATYVAFFFDYDVTMILKSIPEERITRLLDPSKRTYGKILLPVNYDGFEFDYRPGKEFKVRREGTKKWLVISDVGSFFQCSFVRALTAWGIGNTEQIAKVKSGKQMRSGFTEMTTEVIEYNSIECLLLSQLMSKFAAACRGIKYLPLKWQGPGELAAAMLRYHDVPTRKELADYIPKDLLEAANKAYYGGRFETTAIGLLPAPLFAWDINSAYPHSISNLPCLRHGGWDISEKPTSNLFLSYGSFGPDYKTILGSSPAPYLYGLPYRTEKCNIIFPASGKGWYWSPEIDAAKHQKFRPEIVWNYISHCDCKPFDWVEELYIMRKQWEAEGPDTTVGNMGIALKLALNSLYGKMAQSIGMAPYANPVYASLITSLTRAKLYMAVHSLSKCEENLPCGRDVYYLATDGLFTSTGPEQTSLKEGNGLGEWEVERIDEDLLLVQPGLYIGAKGARMKTRGIPKEKVENYAAQFYRAWSGQDPRLPKQYGGLVCMQTPGIQPWDSRTTVQIPFHQFMGIKQSVHLGRLSETGKWFDLPREYGFEWNTKRFGGELEIAGSFRRTLPYDGDKRKDTLGYGKHIGRWLEENREWFESLVWTEAQPDASTFSASKSHIEW